jgi:FolB domain-containing protein
MILQLNSLAVDCIIGELPEERVRLQTLVLDIALEIPDTAAASDELADTVDYAALADGIRAALVEAKCRMIERAAKVAADVCLSDGKVRSVTVKVTKRGAVEGLDSASAVLALNRTEAEA